MTDDLSERRVQRDKLKAQYGDGLSTLVDSVKADWRQMWVEDCRERGRTISFRDWCFTPLDDGDPMSSPFEIANVYEEGE